jgi:hypothetical protein
MNFWSKTFPPERGINYSFLSLKIHNEAIKFINDHIDEYFDAKLKRS